MGVVTPLTEKDIQKEIDALDPKMLAGRRYSRIQLKEGVYILSNPIFVNKRVHLVGNNTKLVFAPGKGVVSTSIGKQMQPLLVIEPAGAFSRIEGIIFQGDKTGFKLVPTTDPDDPAKTKPMVDYRVLAKAGIGINVLTGRVIIEDCTVDGCAIGILIYGGSPVYAPEPKPYSGPAPSPGIPTIKKPMPYWPPVHPPATLPGGYISPPPPWPGSWDPMPDYVKEYDGAHAPPVTQGTNADGIIVRDCDISHCLDGLVVAPGTDSSASTFENNRVWVCRRGVTEASSYGNHYTSNYIAYCPDVEIDSGLVLAPKPAYITETALWTQLQTSRRNRVRPTHAYGLLVPPPEAKVHASTFTANWFESGTPAYIHGGVNLVVGGNMPGALMAYPFYITENGLMVWERQVAERLGLASSQVRFKGGPLVIDQTNPRFGSPVTSMSIGWGLAEPANSPAHKYFSAFAYFQEQQPGYTFSWTYDRPDAQKTGSERWKQTFW